MRENLSPLSALLGLCLASHCATADGQTLTPMRDSLTQSPPPVTDPDWNYAVGYHFTPKVSGEVTALGGRFPGAKRVRLIERATPRLLAEATVVSNNAWSYTPLAKPQELTANKEYTVVVYLAGDGIYQHLGNRTYPIEGEFLTITSGTFTSTARNPFAVPTANYTRPFALGLTDIEFRPHLPPIRPLEFALKGKQPTHVDLPTRRLASGYLFTPNVDGRITALGGFFSGRKEVQLIERSKVTVLASAWVTSTNSWEYVDLERPVSVKKGVEYAVVVLLGGDGGFGYADGESQFQFQTQAERITGKGGYLTITDSVDLMPGGSFSRGSPSLFVGQADVAFLEDELPAVPNVHSAFVSNRWHVSVTWLRPHRFDRYKLNAVTASTAARCTAVLHAPWLSAPTKVDMYNVKVDMLKSESHWVLDLFSADLENWIGHCVIIHIQGIDSRGHAGPVFELSLPIQAPDSTAPIHPVD